MGLQKIKTGYGEIMYVAIGDSVLLDLILIKREFRNKGYGTHMLSSFIKDMKNKGYKYIDLYMTADREVNMDYDRLYDFYIKHGFESNYKSITNMTLDL